MNTVQFIGNRKILIGTQKQHGVETVLKTYKEKYNEK